MTASDELLLQTDTVLDPATAIEENQENRGWRLRWGADWWFPNMEIFFSLFETGVEAASRGQSRSVMDKGINEASRLEVRVSRQSTLHQIERK